jgi:hypothetical protein
MLFVELCAFPGNGKLFPFSDFHYEITIAIFTTNVVSLIQESFHMAASTSIRIDQKLYEQARQDAIAEHRTIAGQVEFWARVGRAALDNPDLPVSFIAESLVSMAEPREQAMPFVPRSAGQ